VLIDWFTIIAQIVNFLILVALLRRFLYRPIVNAMQAREAHIASQLGEAEQKLSEARQAGQRYEQQRAELEAAREDLLREAREAAEARRRELLQQARQEFQEAQARWQSLLQQEQAAFRHELRERAGRQTLAVARQALSDLANADLERQIVAVFVERLRGLDDETRAALAAAGGDGQSPLRLVTGFDLPAEARDQLRQALRDQLGAGIQPEFVTVPEVLAGIELRADGHKLAWSLDGYLDRLEERLAQVLDEAVPAA
jgi:F-type H+-transporting ATPase subunit b